MALEPGKDGKYTLIDENGNIAKFNFAVDAMEAMTLVGPTGESRYSCPGDGESNVKTRVSSNDKKEVKTFKGKIDTEE